MERHDPKSGGRPDSRKLQGLRRPLAQQLVQPFARRLVRQLVQPYARSFAKPFARPFARAFAPLGRLPFALLAALLAAACSEPVDVFYSTEYPVLRVEAEVTLDGVSSGGGETDDGSDEAGTPGGTGTDEPSGDGTGDNPSDDGTGTGSGDSSGDGTGTGAGTGDAEPPADTEALVEAIRAAVLSEAPVAAGGSYRLDFNRADGGDLYVTAAAGAEPVAGSFTKIPASTELTFAYGDHTYTAHLSHYTDGGGPSRVRFAVDLTALYRERYGIESGLRVVRYEYTDHLTD